MFKLIIRFVIINLTKKKKVMSTREINPSRRDPYYPDFSQPSRANRLREIFRKNIPIKSLISIAKSHTLKLILLSTLLGCLLPHAFAALAVVPLVVIIASRFFPSCKHLRKITFEISGIKRLINKRNYNLIQWEENSVLGKIYLGILPNQLNDQGRHLAKDKGVTEVLSVNEPWERELQLLSLPYSKSDWSRVGVNSYTTIDVIDHTPLTIKDLEKAAYNIAYAVWLGKNIYVHCRAGHGRSAMAVAAYLIKHEHKTAQEAADIIKRCRPCSSIYKKMHRLREYQRFCEKIRNPG